MRYHNITKDDILNGDGLRVVLWTAGCTHACKGCQNPLTWDPKGGLDFDELSKKEIFEQLELSYVDGITLSGGDPLHPNNITVITALVKEIRLKYPNKTIWLYTGNLWREIKEQELVRYVDVIVDGRFEEDKMDNSLRWKGSYNQQVIDVKESLRIGKVVLHSED